jgi:hypothetical protein
MTERGTRGQGRGPRKLTPQQQILLDQVTRADDAWREAKLTLKARLRAQLEEELNRFAAARDAAVYKAVEGEVPKSRITTEGLRTSPNALYDAYERHASLLATPGLPEVPEEPFERFSYYVLTHPMGQVYVLEDLEHLRDSELDTVGLQGIVNGWLFARIGDEWIPNDPNYYDDLPAETWQWWVDNRPE